MILLGRNLAQKDGRDVLTDIKQDANLQRIPVVVQTTWQDNEGMGRVCNRTGDCHWYLTKPEDCERFTEVVELLEDFSLNVVALPTRISHE